MNQKKLTSFEKPRYLYLREKKMAKNKGNFLNSRCYLVSILILQTNFLSTPVVKLTEQYRQSCSTASKIQFIQKSHALKLDKRSSVNQIRKQSPKILQLLNLKYSLSKKIKKK